MNIPNFSKRCSLWMGKILFAAWLLLGFPGIALALWPQVYMGGQSIGVLLDSPGLTVVGLSPLTTAEGGHINPAVDAGLQEGDFIVAVDGTKVTKNEEMAAAVAAGAELGRACRIEYIRSGARREAEVTPAWCHSSGSYRLGLYVRDSIVGVGTLTFWEPLSGMFGALGHPVTGLHDSPGKLNSGTVIRASVEGLRSGKAGLPGEKLGVFIDESWEGKITVNGDHGVYGLASGLPGEAGNLLPVAGAEEVLAGAAEIYPVLSGERVECFTVDIVKLGGDSLLTAGGMVITVTDQGLLERTGGIIQGMSGSPIVQNGRLVGAVTHVFVNDPSQGYACYAAEMMEEAGLATQ